MTPKEMKKLSLEERIEMRMGGGKKWVSTFQVSLQQRVDNEAMWDVRVRDERDESRTNSARVMRW
jgi:hypothetical protein